MSVTYEDVQFDRLGHATVRVETPDGSVIYIDPWSEVLEDEPGDGDIVFVTHDDFDHYDPEAIEAVASPEATIAVYEAVDTRELNREVTSLPHEGEVTVNGIDVRTIPAYNDPTGSHVDDDGQPFHAEGEVIGLLLTVDAITIYVCSDTDFLDLHEAVTADVFIPPIGGHYTMDRHEAAAFARSVEPELVLPVHYDTFEAIEADVEGFVTELESDGIRVETF